MSLSSPLLAFGAVLAPDSLTTLQKLTINRLAEVRLGNYMYLLKSLASLSGSDEDAVEAQIFQENALSGDEPIFHSKEAFIESNLDPEETISRATRNRVVEDYLNEFRLMFRADGDDPVEYRILQRAEPQFTDGRLHTSIQYEMRFHGHYERAPVKSYVMRIRVVEFIAVAKGEGNWSVTIASDHSFGDDPTKPFVQYAVDRDLANMEKGILPATPELIQLQKAEDAAKKKAQDEVVAKKANYEKAIAEGDKALSEGDPESAIELYGRAQEIDPLSIDHIVKRKRAERDLHEKRQEEVDRALDQLSADLARQIGEKKITSVVVPEFTTEGATSSMGKYLADQVANRLATHGGFEVLTGKQASKAKAEIRGQLRRTGAANERVGLTATIMGNKREDMQGYAQQEFPIPPGFSTEPVPHSAKKKEPGHWSVGVTAGVNLTRITDTDALTRAFTVNNNGVRVGAELERVDPKGNSRFATGLRLSQFKCSTAEEDPARVIDVVYVQLPLLYRLFTNETQIGRFGIQVGGLLDYAINSTTKSDVAGEYIEVSNFNAHASPGLCYEVPGPGGSHIVFHASYDLMLGRFNGRDLPKEGPRLHALSFAAGVMF